ncbi:putative calmodulin [Schistosoma mansoni]|uniref:Putative calmodulin n=2 Tax=Schistosoma mansoni TaxID=6183 RepID=G4VR87_SCHMA|nr:putative calmodulin [Schistosoma mansoni]|eukprot:XP_018654220.1 putative calmodulin [Schistosoma mansoni]
MDRQLTEQEMRTIFDHMDRNHNGYVTAKELKYFLRLHDARVTNREVKEFIRKLDESGDGQISLHEFMKAFSSQRRSFTTDFRTIRR